MINKLSFKDLNKFKIIIILIFIILCIFAFFLGNIMGATKIPLLTIFRVLKLEPNIPEYNIIFNIRLPRMILCLLVGANLSLSGAILQGVMNNPLADPSIIGVSSGAGLFGIGMIILFPSYTHIVPIGAFCGAMLASFLIYILSYNGGIEPKRIILAGVAVSSLFGAGISSLMVFFSDRVPGALSFMNGSFSKVSWPEVKMILPYSLIGIVISLLLSEKLNILKLGDDVARAVGLNVERYRLIFIAIASLLAASAVSVIGLLGFVGLIVPHTVMLILGGDYNYSLLGSIFLGGALVSFSDIFARTILSPFEIPVGIIMAALGVPFFIILLRNTL